ncbi:MAG: hypothetical protein CL910_20940 [Deltaproteobacteria bacterium]|nr:hypothetical protein [Deltaproteobacteria bacterium]
MLRGFHQDPELLWRAWLHFNGLSWQSLREYDGGLLRAVQDFGYLGWPRKIRDDVQGRDLLEVGCGRGLHAVGYALVGVRRYVGVEPTLDLDEHRATHRGTRESTSLGWSARQVAARIPRLHFETGPFESAAPDERFDVVVMHNVTEHLMDIETVFARTAERIRPGGLLIYHHHSFQCWNGHHRRPKWVHQIVPGDPEQARFVDWNHLDLDSQSESYFDSIWVNRIRLHELRALTEKHFEVETWDEVETDEGRGGGRLTPAILARHPAYTERELLTQGVFCRARRR